MNTETDPSAILRFFIIGIFYLTFFWRGDERVAAGFPSSHPHQDAGEAEPGAAPDHGGLCPPGDRHAR